LPKTIVFCSDGTWNGPESETGESVLDSSDVRGEIAQASFTNVVKLFANLPGKTVAGTTESEVENEKAVVAADGSTLQVMKYLHGVGDSANPINKFLGGVFGLGVISRIVRGFTFISRYYQPGDAIVINGFSRGAYTARALAGMIARVGLLNPKAYDPADKEQAYQLGIAAWARSKSVALEGQGPVTVVANHLLNFVEHVIALPLPDNGLIGNIPIKAVGVWDTVGALGIPLYAGDHRYDLFRLIDQDLSGAVEYGFHAMAIDEMRRDFGITRWNPRRNVREVWFIGAHTDVGGGNPEEQSRLSDAALGWMIGMLDSVGVQFSRPLPVPPNPKAIGQAIQQPWNKVPFAGLPQAPRLVATNDTLHASVVERWNADTSYRPEAMRGLGGKIDSCPVNLVIGPK
jgi:uncharacterized protein (DUF2235 family)